MTQNISQAHYHHHHHHHHHSHDMIAVVQVHSASGTRYTVNVTYVVSFQNERENRYVFSVAENNATTNNIFNFCLTWLISGVTLFRPHLFWVKKIF